MGCRWGRTLPRDDVIALNSQRRSMSHRTFVGPSAVFLGRDPGACNTSVGRIGVQPRRKRGGLPACVPQLHADQSSVCMSKLDDALERGDLAVCPESLYIMKSEPT